MSEHEQGIGESTVALDVEAALLIDGWKDIKAINGGLPVGQPPSGLRRPIIRYSKDTWRAALLARKACRQGRIEIRVSIREDEVVVEGFGREQLKSKQIVERSDRTGDLAEMLTKVAVQLSR